MAPSCSSAFVLSNVFVDGLANDVADGSIFALGNAFEFGKLFSIEAYCGELREHERSVSRRITLSRIFVRMSRVPRAPIASKALLDYFAGV
jgi:hypothetical protein